MIAFCRYVLFGVFTEVVLMHNMNITTSFSLPLVLNNVNIHEQPTYNNGSTVPFPGPSLSLFVGSLSLSHTRFYCSCTLFSSHSSCISSSCSLCIFILAITSIFITSAVNLGALPYLLFFPSFLGSDLTYCRNVPFGLGCSDPMIIESVGPGASV